MQVTGPYYVEKPRFSGEHHAVTVKGRHTIITRGFRTVELAEQFAAAARAATSLAALPAPPAQGELVTPATLLAA